MLHKLHILLLHYLIFDFLLNYANVRAIVGYNVQTVQQNQFPYVVCILKYDPSETWSNNLLCTGTLITPTHILTAEHCFNGLNHNTFEVTIGAHILENGERLYPIWWISYDQWMTIHGREITTTHNDILILKILGLPVKIAPSTISYIELSRFSTGLDVVIVGCGRLDTQNLPRELKMASLKILERSQCMTKISSLQGAKVFLFEKYICSYNEPYVMINEGDSGGPLFYRNSLIGINIAVCPILDGNFHPEQLNIHLSLEAYKDFIISILES